MKADKIAPWDTMTEFEIRYKFYLQHNLAT
jgi:hypothetical protein